jgi:hypothetical protein
LHDLIPLGPALPGALTTAEIDATMAYAEAEKALATRAAHGTEHGPSADLGRRQPRLHRFDRTEPVASGNRDLLPLPFLVALAAPDQDPQPVRDLGQVRDVERAQRSERRNAPAKPRQSSARSLLPIMVSGHSAIICPIRSAVAGALPCFAEPMVRRMPRSVAFTPSLLVGGS